MAGKPLEDRYREMAKELRTIADLLSDRNKREVVIEAAQDYEQMAELLRPRPGFAWPH